jgi:4-oxalocrotonate tautomerase
MPYVNIKVAGGGVTTEQKQELIKGVTQLLYDVLGKNPKSTYVVIDEVDTDNWGVVERIHCERCRNQFIQHAILTHWVIKEHQLA